jgi:SAM-dependent methyltransferase
LLEIGAGFGRLADLYSGYEQVILLDYAKSGLREAQARLGRSGRFVYVAADLYHLPLAQASCDGVVMVRVLHHIVDVPRALQQIAAVLRGQASFVLEYANKRNIKAILRYILRLQHWSPFSVDPIEFVRLNFNFHPRWVAAELQGAGFQTVSSLAVSHFRQPILKRLISPRYLARLDGWLQRPGAALKLAPSVFVRAAYTGANSAIDCTSASPAPDAGSRPGLFRCPACGAYPLREGPDRLQCGACSAAWAVDDGIYDFKAQV